MDTLGLALGWSDWSVLAFEATGTPEYASMGSFSIELLESGETADWSELSASTGA